MKTLKRKTGNIKTTSQHAEELRQQNAGRLHDQYITVGHNPESHLWLWHEGSINVRKPGPDGRTHLTVYKDVRQKVAAGKVEDQWHNLYKGRYDPHQNVISVAVPPKHVHRELPSAMVKQLSQQWPGADIQNFGADDMTNSHQYARSIADRLWAISHRGGIPKKGHEAEHDALNAEIERLAIDAPSVYEDVFDEAVGRAQKYKRRTGPLGSLPLLKNEGIGVWSSEDKMAKKKSKATNFSTFQEVYQTAPPAMQTLLQTEQHRALTDGAASDEADRAALRMAGYAGWYDAGGTWKQLSEDLRHKVAIRRTHAQPDGLFTVFDVPVFYANAVKSAGDGTPIEFDTQTVQNIIDNTNKSPQLPALTPFHVIPQQKLTGTVVPVLGRACNFRADPERPGWALCDFRDLKPETVKQWRAGQIFSFSPGVVEDAGGTNQRFGHIAMLGAEAPALSSLPTTEIYSAGEQVCFSAEEPEIGDEGLTDDDIGAGSGDIEEDDIVTEDDHHWYQSGKLYHKGDRASLAKKMDVDRFWPNVHMILDHGNSVNISADVAQAGGGSGRKKGSNFASLSSRKKAFRYRLRKTGQQQRFAYEGGQPGGGEGGPVPKEKSIGRYSGKVLHRATEKLFGKGVRYAKLPADLRRRVLVHLNTKDQQFSAGGNFDAGEIMDLEALKAASEALNAAIASAEAGEEGAEEKVAQAVQGIEECCGGGGEEGAPVDEGGGEEPPIPSDEGGEVIDDAGGNDADGEENFAPQQDDFHGYSSRRRANFSGESMDSNDPGQLFAANPQAAFAGLFELTASLAQNVKKLTEGLGGIQQRNQQTDKQQQFSAKRADFQKFLTGTEAGKHDFSADGMLAAFDAAGGDEKVAKALRDAVLKSPVKGNGPADVGQVFSANDPTGLNSLGLRRDGREIHMSEVMPGALDDPKYANFAASVATGKKAGAAA